MSHIFTLQEEMNSWQRREFGDTTLEGATLGMVEEMGEVAKVVLKASQKHRGVELEMLGDELADVFIYMTHVALKADIELEYAIEQKWNEVKMRSRKNDDANRKVKF